MTNKEKEKLYTQTIKQLAKHKNWHFKNPSTFRQSGNFFYETVFSINPKENRIRGWLAFKPISIDETYWEITNMSENKKMPLSFRGDAAFKVSSFSIHEFDIILTDFENPINEIKSLIETLDEKAIEVENKISTIEQFLTLLEESKFNNSVEIVTCLIELNEFEKALEKISYFRAEKISSGFIFGRKDFYDLAIEFCNRKLDIQNTFISKLKTKLLNFFKLLLVHNQSINENSHGRQNFK